MPPGRLQRREPEQPGGRGRAENNAEEAPTEAPGDRACCRVALRAPLRIPCKEPLLVHQNYRGPSAQLPQTLAVGPPMAVGTSP